MSLQRLLSRRYARLLLCLLISLAKLAEGKRKKSKYTTAANGQLVGVAIGSAFMAVIMIGGCVYAVAYCIRQAFPDGTRLYSALELDDIRLDRASEFELGIENKINILKKKLQFSRQKKTEILVRKDIEEQLGDKLDKFNSKGMSIYGNMWDSGEVPIRDLISIPEKELRSLQVEAQNIVTQRKAEEERDLWKLWNETKTKLSPPSSPRSLLMRQADGSSRSSNNNVDVLTARSSRGKQPQAQQNQTADPRFASGSG